MINNRLKQIIIKDIKLIDNAAGELLKHFSKPGIFAFYGEMGAGKTTFIQALCRVLKVEDIVTSPTFALVNEYKSLSRGMLYHFDFYRIKNLTEVYDLGYEEYFYQDAYCFIEWPEMIEALLPESAVKIKIDVMKNGSRRISF